VLLTQKSTWSFTDLKVFRPPNGHTTQCLPWLPFDSAPRSPAIHLARCRHVRFLSQPGISSVGITTGLGALAIESLQSHEPALQFANADDITHQISQWMP
jgi:hypothetical protein